MFLLTNRTSTGRKYTGACAARSITLSIIFLLAAQTVTLAVQSPMNSLPIRSDAILFVNGTGGADTSNCQAQGAPCKTIQYAVNQAQTGDTIRLAKGVYTASQDPCGGRAPVVCVTNKFITIEGGYDAAAWDNANPAANPTIIDGESVRRAVAVLGIDVNRATAGLTLSGVTIRNGLARGADSGNDDATFAFGGGILVDYGSITLRNILFENNRAQGGNTANNYGGAGSGGALAMIGSGSSNARALLENLTFVNNSAQGGAGAERGGYAMAGALFLYRSYVAGNHLTFRSNQAIAGNTTGKGVSSGQKGDGQGGAITVQEGGDAILENVIAEGNSVRGGDANNAGGIAGDAFGGAIKVELGKLVLRDALLSNNSVQGGNATNGGLAGGGGFEIINSEVVLDRVTIRNNRATGGDGVNGSGGPAGGGALYLTKFQTDPKTVQINNSVIVENLVEPGKRGAFSGGGGGGIWVQGVDATLTHATIANNRLASAALQGAGLLVLNDGAPVSSKVTLAYSTVAGHVDAPAIHVKPGNSLAFQRNLLANNQVNSNEGVANSGNYSGSASNLLGSSAGFVAAGDYHIDIASLAANAAAGSSESLDRDRRARSGVPDIGAYEADSLVLRFAVLSADSVRLIWANVPNVTEYRVTIECSDGGAAPQGYRCGQTTQVNIDLTSVLNTASLLLRGLTPKAQYKITVELADVNRQTITSAQTTLFTTDIVIYTPIVLR